jgi:hypothetical protein
MGKAKLYDPESSWPQGTRQICERYKRQQPGNSLAGQENAIVLYQMSNDNLPCSGLPYNTI